MPPPMQRAGGTTVLQVQRARVTRAAGRAPPVKAQGLETSLGGVDSGAKGRRNGHPQVSAQQLLFLLPGRLGGPLGLLPGVPVNHADFFQ